MSIGCVDRGGDSWERPSAATSSGRWLRIWAHRPLLLRVARGRARCVEDGEDAVHEAMLRAAERPELDDERLQGWLIAVTRRLCVDGHRQHAREARRWARVWAQARVAEPEQRLEEEACERAEAGWLAAKAEDLPSRQAQALRLRAAGCDVQQVAAHLGVSYRTAESLLARARRTLRAGLTAALGLLAWSWHAPTGAASGPMPVAVAAIAAATAVMVMPVVSTPGSPPHLSQLPPDSGPPPAGDGMPQPAAAPSTSSDSGHAAAQPVAESASSARLAGPAAPPAHSGAVSVVLPPAAAELVPPAATTAAPAVPHDATGTLAASGDTAVPTDTPPPPPQAAEVYTVVPDPTRVHPLSPRDHARCGPVGCAIGDAPHSEPSHRDG